VSLRVIPALTVVIGVDFVPLIGDWLAERFGGKDPRIFCSD
jgi:hypothetical protein